jgi:phosphoenolpyruvate carboxylase
MQKHRRIADLLAMRDRADLTLPERDDLMNALRTEIAAAWETSEVRRERPSPIDEARSGLVVFEQTLWDTLPQYLRVLDRALVKHTGAGAAARGRPDPLRLLDRRRPRRQPRRHARRSPRPCACSRAGRPSVCTCARSTRSGRSSRCARAAKSCGRASAAPTSRTGPAARQVRQRLLNARAWIESRLEGRPQPPSGPMDRDDGGSARPAAPLLPLADRDGRRADGRRAPARPDPARRRLRGDAGAARPAPALGAPHRDADAHHARARARRYEAWSEADRQAFLLEELQGRRPLSRTTSRRRPRCATCSTRSARPRACRPRRSAPTSSRWPRAPSDVLAVDLLQKEAARRTPLRVVPLFETIEDLQHAGGVLRDLLGIPWYRTRCAGGRR